MTSPVAHSAAFADPLDYSDRGGECDGLAPGSHFPADPGGQIGRRLGKSQALAAILETIAATADAPWRSRFNGYAARLRRCADWDGRRCEQAICPRCQKRVAVRNRQQLERRLCGMDRGRLSLLRMLRLSVAAAEPRRGVTLLRSAFVTLRRCAVWRRAVAGGEAHIGIKDARSSELWNIHLHAIIELNGTQCLPKGHLIDEWQRVLRRQGAAGSADLRPAELRIVVRQLKTFIPLAYYVTRRQRGHELLRLDAGRVAAIVNACHCLRLKVTLGMWRRRKRVDGDVVAGPGSSADRDLRVR